MVTDVTSPDDTLPPIKFPFKVILEATDNNVVEIFVVDIFETVIRPVIDALDADKLETKYDVEFSLGMVANVAVSSVATDKLPRDKFDDDKLPTVNVVADRFVKHAFVANIVSEAELIVILEK